MATGAREWIGAWWWIIRHPFKAVAVRRFIRAGGTETKGCE